MNHLFAKSIFTLGTAALILTSCRKDANDDDQQNTKVYLVKTVTDGTQDPQVYQYTYDNKGRITKEVHVQEGTFTYSYTDTSVIEKMYALDGSPEGTRVYKLGANGLAISCDREVRTKEFFTYNSAGQLTNTYYERYDRTGAVEYGSEEKNYYSNGNIDSMVITENRNIQINSFVDEYYDEYYTDKLNTIDNVNFGMGWMGAGSKNLVKKSHHWSSFSSSMVYVTYKYDFDNLGRIVKMTYEDSEGLTDVFAFTYY